MNAGGAGKLTDPDPVVLLWPAGPEDGSAATLRAVLASTTVDTTVMLPRGGDLLLAALDDSARARVTVLDDVGDGGFALTLNEAVRASGRSDLSVLAGAWVLPDGWLGGLRRAARCDDTVAAAFPLVLGESESLFTGLDMGGPVAPWVPDASVRARPVHPRICALPAPCTYFRRATLELLGGADPAFTHPATVLADLAARALASGMSCTLADDVWFEPWGAGASPPPPAQAELRALSERHPWIDPAREDTAAAEVGPLRRSLIAVRASRTRLSVTIDARNLGSSFGGTQTYTAALIRALARSGLVSVRAVVTDDAAAQVSRAQFEDGDVEIVTYEQAVAGIDRTDLVHRPQQVFSPHDLALLRLLGERLVISHLDLIAYRSPSYHRSADDWRSYRRATRLALGAADRVIFLSEHGRRDATTEELIEADRTAVVGIGIDGAGGGSDRDGGREARRPEGVPSGPPFLVMIGADYMHKNRVFALRLVAELRRRHGWDGVLVFAGPHVPYGSSAVREADLLSASPELAAHVLDLGPVDGAEKRWLLQHAQALLCPSTYEGYGLTPLEAAAEGLPCVYPALTSFVDVLGEEGATIVPWDPAASADAVTGLLSPGVERDRRLALLAQALSRCTWESIVDRLCSVYADAIQSPYRASTPRAWEELEREELMVQLYVNYQDLEARVAHGLPLIDRGGLLTLAQQRGLMRVASRRWLRGPVLGPIGLLGDLKADGD